MISTVHYPFTAIVGQERMRLALLLNAIEPAIGGVLIRGEKGTAKSTMARALADLLPPQTVVAGCRFGCAPPVLCAEHQAAVARGETLAFDTRPVPVIELPNNATEDRVAGTLDLSAALREGERRFEPGLLAAANRGILYVDEVNLLNDHLVDLLLDAAAMGINTVERESISYSHPARFILIGTMNPEEGELRPQLLDRFGFCVDVESLRDLEARVEIMRRRAAYERDPASFQAAYAVPQAALRQQIIAATQRLAEVTLDESMLRLIAGIALELGVDGHRADLVMMRGATTLAAFEGRRYVTADDIRRVAELALPHRMRRRPFEQQAFSSERLQEAIERQFPPASPESPAESPPNPTEDSNPPDSESALPPPAPPTTPSAPLALPPIDLTQDRLARSSSGRRQTSLSGDSRGRVVRAGIPTGSTPDIAVTATIRAAATHPTTGDSNLAVEIHPEDIREKIRETKVGAEIIFLVDASGSMGAKRRIEAARGAALTLLKEAYQRRDRVALIAFRARGADLLLPLTDSVELAHTRLQELPTGGRTPLAAGLVKAQELIRQIQRKDARAIILLVLITDGKANVALGSGQPVEEAIELARQLRQPGLHMLVLDTENDFLNFGLARQIAEAAGARYVRLTEIDAPAVVESIRAVH